jgi:hypothetical protein
LIYSRGYRRVVAGQLCLELGVRPRLACNTAGSGLGPWYLAKTKALSVGLSNVYFSDLRQILGSNLSGSTSVTFNGAAAVFTEVSNSFILATVPAGATSGNSGCRDARRHLFEQCTVSRAALKNRQQLAHHLSD